MKNLTKILLVALVAIQISCSGSVEKNFDADHYLTIGAAKTKAASARIVDSTKFPRYIDHGDSDWTCVNVYDWTSGFYPGVLWFAYEQTQDAELKAKAELFTEPLSQVAYATARDHDIGFMIYCSYGNGYRLTGNPEYKKAMLSAADTLATLFNPTVGTIHSWPFKPEYEHNTIIDNMMNLELLFWASKNGGGKRLEDIAVSHAEVTQKYIVRPDSAVYHLGQFTHEGEFVRGVAHQGYADESMWARGQAWGIYGYAICYREVGRKDFLATSMKLADHFMNRLPEDGVPFWDYDDPAIPSSPKDASAAAVAASGMLELSILLDDQALSQKYYNNAVELLAAISTDDYILGDESAAILDHSTGHHPKGWEIDVPIIYGDYYYLEALTKLKKIDSQK